MIGKPHLRKLETILAFGLILALAACAQIPSTPWTPAPQIGNGYPDNIDILKPGPSEVIVVINDNAEMVHSGMFAAETLLDPAGSYTGTRDFDPHWQGISLQDYVRFQLEDGPVVKLYRFTLPPEQFAQIKERVDSAGATMPLFCAAKVQNILSGIAPFESVPDAWLVSPATLAHHLDVIVGSPVFAGACYWPNGASCNPRNTDISLETSGK